MRRARLGVPLACCSLPWPSHSCVMPPPSIYASSHEQPQQCMAATHFPPPLRTFFRFPANSLHAARVRFGVWTGLGGLAAPRLYSATRPPHPRVRDSRRRNRREFRPEASSFFFAVIPAAGAARHLSAP
ncbi:hypothetical protein C8R44DRAFT_340040 [Mycena epipterygia]|nr:hypothetical protein C8R44DRAFT_340040 [Mycena epipterygia]